MWPVPSGGSRREKNFAMLAQLAVRHPGIIFVIAGSGPERDQIAALASRLGVDSRLRLLGPILDRPLFFDALDAFILPSLYEGLPMVILEAMSSGVPIISSRLEGIAAVIAEGKEGLFAQPGDVADFSRQLSLLKESPDFRRASCSSCPCESIKQILSFGYSSPHRKHLPARAQYCECESG